MARNYAALPHEYLTEMELLTDAEFGRLIRALLAYSATGEAPSLSGSERVLFPRVKAQEDRFKASYEELTQKRKAAASKSWESRKSSRAKQNDAPLCAALQPEAKTSKTETQTETKTKSILPYGRDTKAGVDNGAELCARVREAFIRLCPQLEPPGPAERWPQARKRGVLNANRPLPEWERLFAEAAKSDFLCGKKKDFKAFFDWFLDPNHAQKVLEGVYRNRPAAGSRKSRPATYDLEDFERSLMQEGYGAPLADKPDLQPFESR